jgi:hypothetical protein
MRTLSAIAMLAALTGCGYLDRVWAHIAPYALVCVKETGVMYVQFASGAAVLVDANGKPKACQ